MGALDLITGVAAGFSEAGYCIVGTNAGSSSTASSSAVVAGSDFRSKDGAASDAAGGVSPTSGSATTPDINTIVVRIWGGGGTIFAAALLGTPAQGVPLLRHQARQGVDASRQFRLGCWRWHDEMIAGLLDEGVSHVTGHLDVVG